MAPIKYNGLDSMLTCRDIPACEWEHARQALRFYFSRRLGQDNAEDLAQETLLRFWSRPDFQFDKVEDFPRVCFGFAHYVCQQICRENAKRAGVELDIEIPSPAWCVGGPQAAEAAILLRETLEVGRGQLEEKEWKLIQNASDREMLGPILGPADGKDRVKLHRARRKLARLVGWKTE